MCANSKLMCPMLKMQVLRTRVPGLSGDSHSLAMIAKSPDSYGFTHVRTSYAPYNGGHVSFAIMH